MKTIYLFLLSTITALALAGTAVAQVPSTNDTSDGNNNTGMGTGALNPATTGSDNTASGAIALFNNTTGNGNTATGKSALLNNTIGAYNTALGLEALSSNTTGQLNTASGTDALLSNTTGNNNTASGVQALQSNTTGSYNIAEGYFAGFNLTTGSNNIDIGNVGVAGESNVIRIGTKGTHKAAVIAGIDSSKVTGNAVYVTSSGRLGVLASSERYKTAIAPIGADTAKLQELRPVKFHLKTDPKGTLQYGLIAEEVAKVYPELVIRDEKGRIDGVRYDELAPMLLNEVQQQRTQMTEKIRGQAAQIRALKRQMAELKAFNLATQSALRKLQANHEFVAQR